MRKSEVTTTSLASSDGATANSSVSKLQQSQRQDVQRLPRKLGLTRVDDCGRGHVGVMMSSGAFREWAGLRCDITNIKPGRYEDHFLSEAAC